MARKLILLVLFFVIFMKIFALAGPANPHPMEFTQDDGSVIRLFLRGDEFFSWWEDARGYIVPGDGKTRADALLPQIQRAWRFNPANPAPKANDAPVIAPKMPAVPHIVLPPGTILPSPTFEPPPPIRQTPLRDPIIIGMGGIAEPRPPVLTEQKLLLVLLEFNDMSLLNSDEFFYDKYFNSDPDAISVANYFRDMSGGREIFVPAGIRRVRLDMPHPIADWQNSPNGHEAARAALMQALAAIRNTGFDFTGVHIAAIFAGGEASDNSNPGGQIWAHTWNFSGADIGVAGRPRYIAYGEQQRGRIATGVGIAAHELGHILGLP
ncbi:MAG: hypothetical protein LBE35_09665, partial [Clostridiales bacterium]|nr:hypothetical protein [Clostridiales bacterium]